LVALALVLAGVAGIFLLRSYAIRRYYGGGQVIWRHGELYVLIGVNTTGGRQSRAFNLLTRNRRWSPLAAEKLRQDLMVLHVTTAGHQAYELRDFPSGVKVAPAEGVLYGSIGCETAPCPVWKWTGDRFEPLPDDVAEAIRAARRPSLNDAIRKNGWHVYDVEMAFRPGSVRLPLEGFADDSAELVLNADDATFTLKSISLERGPNRTFLWGIDENWSFVDKSAYGTEHGHWGLRSR
jgi:hypothetical protein